MRVREATHAPAAAPDREAPVASLTVVGRPLVAGRAGVLELEEPACIEIAGGRIAGVGPVRTSGMASMSIGHPDLVLAPALSDPHVHLMAAASARTSLDLATHPPGSLDELFGVLKRHAAGLPGDAWLRAHGYDEAHLREGRHPTAEELARALPQRRVRLRHATLHASVLSLAALQTIAGALSLSHDEHNGFLVEREEELTTLCGGGGARVRDVGLAELGRELTRGGIAWVDDLTATNDANRVATLAQAVARGAIPQRVRVWLGDARDFGPARTAAGSRVQIAGVKLLPTSAEETASADFAEALARARRAGLPVAIHAVEADVIDGALDALHAAPQRRPGGPPGPDRLEHCSLCPPHLVERLARSGCAVVTQPGFLFVRGARYARWVEKPLWPWLYPVASMLRAGILVAASSDAPVIPPRPALTFLGATKRRSSSGVLLAAQEAISDSQALSLCTSAAARIRGEADADLPWLRAGARADIAVLASDPRGDGMGRWEASTTIVGGRPFGGMYS